MPPDSRTQRKLEHNGKIARVGDRETGIWVVDETGWWQRGDAYVYLEKGTRLVATWKFTGQRWVLAKTETDNLVESEVPPTWRQRLWRWLFPWTDRKS